MALTCPKEYVTGSDSDQSTKVKSAIFFIILYCLELSPTFKILSNIKMHNIIKIPQKKTLTM